MAINRSEYLNRALPGTGGAPYAQPPVQNWTSSNNIINRAVPNGSKLTSSASSMVQKLLSGMPGTDRARRTAAYGGVASGMPNSNFASQRGFDLYNEEADRYQQRGFDDLLSLLSSTTSPVLSQQSQDINQAQYGADLGERQRQYNLDYGLRRDEYNSRYNRKRGGMIGTQRWTGGGLTSPQPTGPYRVVTNPRTGY
jgi:hypothetical protein